ncbi:MAG: LamG domain-containing protein [Sedimentisphaerales bacterium]
MCRRSAYLTPFVLVFCLTVGVMQADLRHHWRFDGDLDDRVGSLNLTSTGGGFDFTVGKHGGGVEFDGGGDYIYAELAVFMPSQTTCVWVRTSSSDQSILGWSGGHPTDGLHDRELYVNGDGTVTVRVWTGAATTVTSQTPVDDGAWHHLATGYTEGGETWLYVDGVFQGSTPSSGIYNSYPTSYLTVGIESEVNSYFTGAVDDVRVYDEALTEGQVLGAMVGGAFPFAFGPVPKDGTLYEDTWVSLSWRPGDLAVSHNVYLGDNFDDVNDGVGDTFRGNESLAYFVVGFPGYPYPDGLVPGTTYYWRIDEVNEAEPNSPWKGDVWSFSIPPKTSYFPIPADGAEFVDLNVQLKWTAGFGTKLHYIVFGEDFDEVSNAAAGIPNGPANYTPGPLNLAKTYYWRVDEFDGIETHKGEVWSFTTLGAVSGPNPANGAVDVKPTVILNWDAGAVAASHDVYFGTDADAVANATTTSPEYKGTKALGEESYNPGKLTLNTAYYWRIDEVNGASTDSPWAGNAWSFTTGDFFVIDDFEDYDDGDNQIWYSWHDGLGYGAQGNADYYAGNGTGSAVGDEVGWSSMEQFIVHGGQQSVPFFYDNNKQGFAKYSEGEHTLTDQRDWTEEGVTELSLWFRGYPGSVGSFTEAPVGIYTMTASGTDIWNSADEFHYAYKTLTGIGSIVAKVESVDNTNGWAKAGVMIRETLDLGSAHATMVVTPAQGVSFQRRPSMGATSTSANSTTGDEAAPYWVKIERDLSGNFTSYHSANGSTWTMQGASENIQMSSNVYIGLAVTSHDAALTCQAVFTNVTTTGSVSPQWANQDIGIESNAAEPLYVAVFNPDGIGTGTPAIVIHDDPAAATIDTWTEWIIPLQAFADQGINLTDVDRIAIGLGTKGNMATPGGSGKMYFDDARLYQPRNVP